jgi:hypothetical protein
MRTSRGFELTYCTNIHAADGWPQVLQNIRNCVPELKRRLSPDARFGIGLRLANSEAIELVRGNQLDEFSEFLWENGLYVALINGFPYGNFHGCKLKDEVFAPDWHTEQRVDYTLRLLIVLRKLLPQGHDGSVSTCPLSYKRWQPRCPDWDLLIQNVVRVAVAMFDAKRNDGLTIHLDLEPEPDGLIETTQEVIQFYKELLRVGAPVFAKSAQITVGQAEDAIREHVALCYDLCHSAVEHEIPQTTLQALQTAGIRIGRIQVSSAVKAQIPQSPAERMALKEYLGRFADTTYLHQIIGDGDRFPDLPDGLARLDDTRSSEWLIHYHVPLFIENYGVITSTQQNVRDVLLLINTDQVHHFEIETYTWGVLPDELKLDLVDSIEREYRWVLAQL